MSCICSSQTQIFWLKMNRDLRFVENSLKLKMKQKISTLETVKNNKIKVPGQTQTCRNSKSRNIFKVRIFTFSKY